MHIPPQKTAQPAGACQNVNALFGQARQYQLMEHGMLICEQLILISI